MAATKYSLSPGPGGMVSLQSATGNGFLLPTAPLPSNPPQRRRMDSSQSEGLYQWAATITHRVFGADEWH
jgi:hypothetical protein